jgi:ribonuclease BN (tRNA processing enzyme)
MKVTVVGYWGGYPEAESATSGYLLEHEGFQLLVDCGSGVLAQLQKYIQVAQLDAVIISHYHNDHIADVGVLQYARLIRSFFEQIEELPIYGHTCDERGFAALTHEGHTKGIAYEGDNELQVGPFTITFMQTNHPVVCYAMRISAGGKTVVYTADSSYTPSFVPFAQNADLLITDCNMYEGQDGSKPGHMSSVEVAGIAKEAKVKELVLSHLPHAGDHQQLVTEASRVYNGKITLAHAGYTWEE